MNLPQAIVQARDVEVAAKAAIDAEVRRQLENRNRYLVRQYFHDCLPGCKPTSPRFEDHVPLPGNERPTCRVLYPKMLAFFAAAHRHRERVFLAANRIGKTQAAAFELRCHLTGRYPKWWPGVTFEGPSEAWAAGDTRQTTRDIIQQSLMGKHEGVPTSEWGGMLDPHLIAKVVRATGGVANCLDTVYVEHVEKYHGAPMLSELAFKSYDQGRRVFQGTAKRIVWLDEEPPDGAEAQESQAEGSSDIWTECLLRTMTVPGGMLIATFTPLRGMTPFLKQYIETAVMPGTEAEDVDARSNFFPDVLDLAGEGAYERAMERVNAHQVANGG